jgi:HlyD family secretion protein
MMKPIYRSTVTEVPRPAAAPPSAPVISLPPEPKPRRATGLLLGIAAAVGIALIAWGLLTRARRGRSLAGPALQVATTSRTTFIRTLRLAGTLEAVHAVNIAAPQTIGSSSSGRLVLTRLAPSGTGVKKGDLVAEFDDEKQIQNYQTAQSTYQGLLDQITAKRADEAAARAKDDTDLKKAEDAVGKDQLEILKDPILSPNQVQTNELNLKEDQGKLKELRLSYALKRQSAAAGIRDLQIQAKAQQLAMAQAKENEQKMTVRSPANGIAVINTTWKGNTMGPYEVGDSVRPGAPFVRIVNPDLMEVQLDVNQLDMPYVKAGEPVEIRMDAYPQLVFQGAIESLSPIAEASDFSDKMRTLAAVALLDGHDPRLMPDLSASVDVVLQKVPGALVIPRDAILWKKQQAFVLLKSALNFRRQKVTVGALSDTRAVIQSGLEAGDVVERNVM